MLQTATERDLSKVLSRWSDLDSYGIFVLTGESCALTMRMLCDVSKSGKELLERFWGGSVVINADSQWNNSRGAVGSVLLSYNILPELMAFALHYRDGYNTIVHTKPGNVVGLDPREVESYLKDAGGKCTDWREYVNLCFGEIERIWSAMHASRRGRNLHHFAQRYE